MRHWCAVRYGYRAVTVRFSNNEGGIPLPIYVCTLIRPVERWTKRGILNFPACELIEQLESDEPNIIIGHGFVAARSLRPSGKIRRLLCSRLCFFFFKNYDFRTRARRINKQKSARSRDPCGPPIWILTSAYVSSYAEFRFDKERGSRRVSNVCILNELFFFSFFPERYCAPIGAVNAPNLWRSVNILLRYICTDVVACSSFRRKYTSSSEYGFTVSATVSKNSFLMIFSKR